MSYKTWDRYSLSSILENQPDPRGRLFLSNLGQVNLAPVTILREGVDTIRQLYDGFLKPDVLAKIQDSYDLGPGPGGRGRLVEVLGREWLLGSGGKSGYRFRLQDSDLGAILFVSSRYVKENVSGSHFKIELSPHFIDQRNNKIIQGYMNNLASRLLSDPKPAGCAVHLCVDVQGWAPPRDFADLLITRSRRRVDYRGISQVEFDLSELAVVYGSSQSFLFGSASGLQFSLYRKDLQAEAVDKLHFWRDLWTRRTDENFDPFYDPKKPVWRFEFRYHHSVINEFGDFIQESLKTFDDLVLHLTGLFRYGLENFRLNAVSSSSSRQASFYRGLYIDPMWQLLLQDVAFLSPDSGFFYRRARKDPGLGGVRNVRNAVGNLLSLYARYGIGPVDAVKYLMQSGIWEDVKASFRSRFKEDIGDVMLVERITQDVAERLRIRTLLGACV